MSACQLNQSVFQNNQSQNVRESRAKASDAEVMSLQESSHTERYFSLGGLWETNFFPRDQSSNYLLPKHNASDFYVPICAYYFSNKPGPRALCCQISAHDA